MKQEGPYLEQLLQRLAACPAEMLAEPRSGRGGVVETAAVVSDLLVDLGGQPLAADEAAVFKAKAAGERQRLGLILLGCWLLHDDWFVGRGGFAPQARRWLEHGLDKLAGLHSPEEWIGDVDRREELARLALRALDLRPAGETLEQAQDRLATLDSLGRQWVLQAARAAEERAQAIREAMARKAAEEAAAKVTRE